MKERLEFGVEGLLLLVQCDLAVCDECNGNGNTRAFSELLDQIRIFSQQLRREIDGFPLHCSSRLAVLYGGVAYMINLAQLFNNM